MLVHTAVCDRKLNETSVDSDIQGLGTKADPYDLTEMKEVMFVELCDYCGSDIEHDGSFCLESNSA